MVLLLIWRVRNRFIPVRQLPYEVDAYRGNVVVAKAVILSLSLYDAYGKSDEETGLADTGVSDEHELEQVIATQAYLGRNLTSLASFLKF
jgi:hypothetical protein